MMETHDNKLESELKMLFSHLGVRWENTEPRKHCSE